MNIQNNTSNTTAFQAKLVIRNTSANTKRIANIQKIFENNTKNMNGTLYYSSSAQGKASQEGFSTVSTETNFQTIFKDSLKDMITKLPDKKIAEKFAKVYECIKKEANWNREEAKMIDEIKKITFLATENQKRAEGASNDGFHKVAKMYDVIAQRNFNRLETLKLNKSEKFEKYINDLKQIIDNDKDFDEYLKFNRIVSE